MAAENRNAGLARRLAEGERLHREGRLAQAERLYREVLRRDAGNSAALHLLVELASQTGRFGECVELLTRAVRREPRDAALYQRLAEAHRANGDYDRAYQAYIRVFAFPPGDVAAHVDCAVTAAEAAEKAQDPAARRRWRTIAAEQFARVGELHAAVRSGARAETAFRHALEFDSETAEIPSAYADLLVQMGRLSEAEPLYRRALALRPDFPDALNNLASALAELGRPDEAEPLFRRALELEPGLEEAAYALSSGRLMQLCYRSDVSAEALFEAHRRWGAELVARQSEPAPSFPNSRDPERPLKIGYASPDFRQHSIVSFFETLLARHDESRFEIYCYAEVAEPDAATRRLQGLARHWRSTVGMSDRELREKVRADGIDILIDLAGHTARTRLPAFAVKPAPVTATWLGYPATTGLATVDYRVTDALADPPGAAERLHTERLARLPGGFLCHRPPADAPAVSPAPVLARGSVTFGSFNNLAKVTAETIETWSEILRAVPTARLLLKGKLFADAAMVERYRRQFAAEGVAAERLVLRPLIPGIRKHLRLYGEVDIGLDPFPYNGTTTTCEALYMGVPVVSLVGDRHAARVGLSLLSQVGLPHLVASDRAEYVRIAASFASDAAALGALRLGLRQRLEASTLMDAPRFARVFEAALRDMWRQCCAEA